MPKPRMLVTRIIAKRSSTQRRCVVVGMGVRRLRRFRIVLEVVESEIPKGILLLLVLPPFSRLEVSGLEEAVAATATTSDDDKVVLWLWCRARRRGRLLSITLL